MTFNKQDLLKKLGVNVADELLILALTHKSFAFEAGIESNERMEFLGDSVLNYTISDYIFNNLNLKSEHELSGFRAQVVSTAPLANIARKLDLDKYVMLGVGEEKTGGRQKDKILEDTIESIIAAVYQTNGLEITKEFIMKHFLETIEQVHNKPTSSDYKTALTVIAKQEHFGEPVYEFEEHESKGQPEFKASVYFSKTDLFNATAYGTSKKQASIKAAKIAYSKVQEYLKYRN